MLMYDLLAVLLALLIVVYTWFKWSFQYWKKRNVPNLEPRFPYGNTEPPARRTVDFGTNIHEICNKAKEKGIKRIIGKKYVYIFFVLLFLGWKYFGIYLFNSPVFIPLEPELVKQIMTKDFNHFVDRGLYFNEKDDPLS